MTLPIRWLIRLAVAVLVLSSVASIPIAVAHHAPGHGGGGGGGGGGGEDPTPEPPALDGGTIYFSDDSTGAVEVHSIAPDGTGDQVIAGLSSELAKPSLSLHNGDRWYVALRPGWEDDTGRFPGGASSGRLFELDIVQEGATASALTDNAGACIQMYSARGVEFDWSVDSTGQLDGAITWAGTRWSDDDGNGTCDTVVDGGIFRGEIDIDAAGNVTFVQPTAPVIDVPLSGSGTVVDDFSWSSDGQQAAYIGASNYLYVEDLQGSSTLVYGDRAHSVAWSPDLDPDTAGDQTRIGFTGAETHPSGAYYKAVGTYTMLPDGSDRQMVASGVPQTRNETNWTVHWDVAWSPAGTHLIYVESGPGVPDRELHRVATDGSGNDVLASTGVRRGLGWSID